MCQKQELPLRGAARMEAGEEPFSGVAPAARGAAGTVMVGEIRENRPCLGCSRCAAGLLESLEYSLSLSLSLSLSYYGHGDREAAFLGRVIPLYAGLLEWSWDRRCTSREAPAARG